MPPSAFSFKWLDVRTLTDTQNSQISAVYKHAFEVDIGLEFNPKLDSDFIDPAAYYSPVIRGAYGVIVDDANDTIVGTVGLRPIDIADGFRSGEGGSLLPPPAVISGPQTVVCELKRMFILPCARGQGLSKIMLREVMQRANDFGYEAMVLDTQVKLTAANHLYERSGFVDCARYNDNYRADRFMICALQVNDASDVVVEMPRADDAKPPVRLLAAREKGSGPTHQLLK